MSLSERYDAGLLNDYGGGDVAWWQDYIRAELGRADDFYAETIETQAAEIERLRASLARPEPSEAVVEAVARGLCRHIGDDPDLQMSGGEARWEWLAGHARAAIAAYEAERLT